MKSEEFTEVYTFRQLTDDEKIEIAELVADSNLSFVNRNCHLVHFQESFYTKYGKRIIDFLFALLAVIITSPINLLLMIGTLIDVGRPVLFFQTRIGKNKKLFRLGKFRNMTNERDENGILLPASERVTRFGSFVRRSSLDEFLNFWYILIGKMSLIGPRPMPDEYLNRFSDRHNMRHVVKPGLECPLHSNEYIGGMTWGNRFENDIWYVENISFRTDIKMLWLLVEDALFSSRKNDRAEAKVGTFIGYNRDGSIIDSENIPKEFYEEIIKKREL